MGYPLNGNLCAYLQNDARLNSNVDDDANIAVKKTIENKGSIVYNVDYACLHSKACYRLGQTAQVLFAARQGGCSCAK